MDDAIRGSERTVRLIGAACNLGAPPEGGVGCARGPEALRSAGIDAVVRHGGLRCEWDGVLHPPSGDRAAALRRFCGQLAERIVRSIKAGDLPLVVGGDHAIAAGTWAGASQAAGGRFGLLWIDAHLDAHTPRTTPSGNLHGMPLAALLGEDGSALSGVAPPLAPERICVLGVRSFEEEEARLLQRRGVRVLTMDDVRRRGLAAVFADALAYVRRDADAYGVTLDVDAIDPREAPGVSVPSGNGLSGAELAEALRGLARDSALAALEIAEYNPEHDPDGRTARLVIALVGSLCAPSGEQLRAWESAYGAHNYAPLPVVLARSSGVWVWDTEGRPYIDMMSAYSAASFGHSHPRLVSALTRQADRLAVTSRAFFNDQLPLLLRRLNDVFGYEAALPVNTGLEAVETAIKAARKWGYARKGIARDEAEIIACQGNFHGRSTTIVGMSTEAQYRDGFGPFAAGFKCIPYGDAATLETAITPRTAAFLVEPIQGEAGIVLPPDGYLSACADICRKRNVLLICDEVQTGLGRTGKLLASWHEGVRPDGVILGKALGGGLLPVSAFLADRRVMDVFTPGDHGSTFGGNALAAAVALEALDLLLADDLAARSAALGEHLLMRLRGIRSPLVRAVRGRGLFAAIDLEPQLADAWTVCLKLLAHGVLSKDTHHSVVRLAPPLVIEQAELDEAIDRIVLALAELERELAHSA